MNINGYDVNSKKVRAKDTSMDDFGFEKRDLKSVNANEFDRLILIEVKKKQEE